MPIAEPEPGEPGEPGHPPHGKIGGVGGHGGHGGAGGSMGLGGMFATIGNTAAVTIIAALFVWLLVKDMPQERERIEVQRQADRMRHEAEVQRARDREDDRMRRFWEKQVELKAAIDALVVEIRTANAKTK